MAHPRFPRVLFPLTLVVGFAIFAPVRSYAAAGSFEFVWERLSDLLWGRAAGDARIGMDSCGRPAPSGLTAGGAKGLFANNGISMDPNGRPEPNGVTGGGSAAPLQDN